MATISKYYVDGKEITKYNNSIISNITINGTDYNFASRDNLVGVSSVVCDNSVNEKIADMRVYGNSVQDGIPTSDSPVEIKSVGDFDESINRYNIPIKINETITKISIKEPLRKVGDYVDYVDYKRRLVVRNVQVVDNTGTQTIENSFAGLTTSSYESFMIPDIQTSRGTTTISVETSIKPSGMSVEYQRQVAVPNPMYTITFPTGVSVKANDTNITSGTQLERGTNIVVSYALSDGYQLKKFEINGQSVSNNTTISVTGNIDIVFVEEQESSGGGGDISFSTVLSENSPATISAISDIISANNMTSAEVEATYGWKVGDTIPITLTTGETITMRINGYNHDTLSSDHTTKAGISWGMTNCLATRYPMNSMETNAGGYAESVMKTSVLPIIKALFPQEWQNVIKLVDKKSANGGSANYSETLTLSEDLFLFAEIEIFGTTSYAHDGANEGSIYEYWNGKTNADRIKKYDTDADGIPDTATYWWFRSSCYNNTLCFCAVNTSGKAYYNYANNSRGLSFGFCT